MPLVSLIIVNYNGLGLTIDCLKVLEEKSFKDSEIIIRDNASIDNSLDEIKNYLKGCPLSSSVKLIPLDKNTGFATGCLEGLRHAHGDYIALLNNDTEPDEEWLAELVKAMDTDPSIGLCASKMIVHGTNIIDSAGDGFPTALRGFGEGEQQKSFLYKERMTPVWQKNYFRAKIKQFFRT